MTISVEEYFKTRKSDRKKETRYINVINKDSCTSCNACAVVCPVDCIFEVVERFPSQSYHQIDTSRCIGCQLCYRVPADSTEHYTLEICPWNAIDMLHNPNVKPDDESVLQPYYRPAGPAGPAGPVSADGGESGVPVAPKTPMATSEEDRPWRTQTDLAWPKLEEYAYQLFLDGEVFLPVGEEDLQAVMTHLQAADWMYGEDENCRIVADTEEGECYLRYRATDEGRDLLDVVFEDYHRIFMD